MPDQTPRDASLWTHFASLKDKRMERCRKHSLQDILVIAICGFLCGVDNWADMELFGNAKLAWFRTFLELPNGIPSHDTFGRVFSLLEPEPFARCFTRWAQTVAEATEGKVVAIDGKAVRRGFDKAGQKACVHLVNAWVAENRCVLGQVACEEKSNEITAIPQLLDLLSLKGSIVTLDAMGCQRAIVAVREKNETQVERRYFISSLPADDAARMASVVRTHWAVENDLHWSLDVAFREDESRVREEHAQQNMAMMRRLALSLLKQDTRTKAGIAARRKKAGWDHDYLLALLTLRS